MTETRITPAGHAPSAQPESASKHAARIHRERVAAIMTARKQVARDGYAHRAVWATGGASR